MAAASVAAAAASSSSLKPPATQSAEKIMPGDVKTVAAADHAAVAPAAGAGDVAAATTGCLCDGAITFLSSWTIHAPAGLRVADAAAVGIGVGVFTTRDCKQNDVLLANEPPLVEIDALRRSATGDALRKQLRAVNCAALYEPIVITVLLMMANPAHPAVVHLNSLRGKDGESVPADEEEIRKDLLNTQNNFLPVQLLDRTALNRAFAIVHTNMMRVQNKPVLRIYRWGARLNHSCTPNCTFDRATGVLTAQQSIQAGAELTISYAPPFVLDWPWYLRRAALRARTEWVCLCTSCTSDEKLNSTFSNPASEQQFMAQIDLALEQACQSACIGVWSGNNTPLFMLCEIVSSKSPAHASSKFEPHIRAHIEKWSFGAPTDTPVKLMTLFADVKEALRRSRPVAPTF